MDRRFSAGKMAYTNTLKDRLKTKINKVANAYIYTVLATVTDKL